MRRAADGDVLAAGENEQFAGGATQALFQPGADRELDARRGRDDATVGVKRGEQGKVTGADLLGKNTRHFVVEAKVEGQYAEKLAAAFDAVGVEQVLAGRQEVGCAEIFDKRRSGRARFVEQGVVAGFGRVIVEAGNDPAVGGKQDDVGVDGVLLDILAKAAFHAFARAAALEEFADVVVRREKADVGGAFEKIADQYVDADLCLGAQVGNGLAPGFLAEMVEQVAGQALEGFTCLRHLGGGTGELAEQTENVPDALQVAEPFAVILDTLHVADDAGQGFIDFDVLVDGHACSLL